MDKPYPSITLMAIRALEKETGPFWPQQEGKEYWALNTHTLVSLEH
jgi:hypothetical protein